MTPSQKAAETRQKHRESQKRKEAELKEPSTIFPPPETRSGEYEVLKTMCEGFTRALEQFVEREG